MIHLVTLNPALDLDFVLKKTIHGKIGEVLEARVAAGGKALNVARFLKKFRVPFQIWIGTGGGQHPTHVLYRSLLDREGLKARFLSDKAPIRFNVVIENGKNAGKYNHPGFEMELTAFGQLQKTVKKNDLLVLTGRLPQGVNPALYGAWIKSFNRIGARTVVDTSGQALNHALVAHPWFFKVNLFEMEEGLNRQYIGTLKRVKRFIPSLRETGLIHGAVTQGFHGAILWNEEEAVEVKTPMKVRGLVVGAGDAFLAGYLKGFSARKSFLECAKLACAAGTTVALSGIGGFNNSLFQKQLKKVKVKRLP